MLNLCSRFWLALVIYVAVSKLFSVASNKVTRSRVIPFLIHLFILKPLQQPTTLICICFYLCGNMIFSSSLEIMMVASRKINY